MNVVIDGLPLRGTSLAVVIEQLLAGWQRLGEDDAVHLVVGADADLKTPPEVEVHRVPLGRLHALTRLRAQTLELPRVCRTVRADVLLGSLPTTAAGPLPCPRAVVAHDLRHELRPDQFSRRALVLRQIGYGLGFRQADAVICISERTRDDLLWSRPWLRRRVVRVALLGADHVLDWDPAETEDQLGHAIAFGQYQNKNVDLVIDAWSILQRRSIDLPLVIVGLPDGARAAALGRISARNLEDRVTVHPWLTSGSFQRAFVSAGLVVFPSDFEGFGLPAIEAMRLGIPLVVSPDPALLEVTGGFATVVDGDGPEALADAVTAATQLADEQIAAARAHAASFTWERAASAVRAALVEVVNGSG